MSDPAPAPRAQLGALEDQIVEFARLSGYRLTLLGRGLVRLTADLGPAYGYTVLLATDREALSSPEWDSGDDHRALITTEEDRAPGVPRLTREALVSLIEHARLAPLGALDLRGYWRAGTWTSTARRAWRNSSAPTLRSAAPLPMSCSR
ncbi:hypothetical protein MSS93_05055 [Deinococcus radiodurans]|nr:hypothetical protein MSS93_05055 [Deinococcus radiodurans]